MGSVAGVSSGRFDLEGRTALVTGAARGLGRAIALALAEAGADVALRLRDGSRDDGLADEVRAHGRRVLPLQMDVTRLDQVEAAVAATVEELGALDLLVNNAGGGVGHIPAEQVSVADFERAVDSNLKSTFFACRAAFPAMRRGFGRTRRSGIRAFTGYRGTIATIFGPSPESSRPRRRATSAAPS
jgi:NAD(P)-dependent dehydrogenase (short-subunit alcohol dehydrogenase family)